jgi:hypothetical protein
MKKDERVVYGSPFIEGSRKKQNQMHDVHLRDHYAVFSRPTDEPDQSSPVQNKSMYAQSFDYSDFQP